MPTLRPHLSVRTTDLYRWLLDKQLVPTLGDLALGELTPSAVRTWHTALNARSKSTAAKAYRLLNSIMRSAVADEVIARSPCTIKGAAVEVPKERPIASIQEVQALADAMPDHLRIAVLLAAWCQMRPGELLGLRRRDVDPPGALCRS